MNVINDYDKMVKAGHTREQALMYIASVIGRYQEPKETQLNAVISADSILTKYKRIDRNDLVLAFNRYQRDMEDLYQIARTGMK
jgi:hypothetical protein